MLNTLFKFIFKIITKIADIILTPLISGITALFPALGVAFTAVLNFCDSAFSLIPLIIDALMIPRTLIIALLDYYIIKYSIYLVRKTYNFALNCYNYFKP